MDAKLKKSLKECRSTCALSLRALASSSKQNESLTSTLPAGLGEAVAGLLVNLRQTTTALGLAFKPPISVDAAIQQLDKTSDQIGKLISCVLLTHGYLAEEWKAGVEGIGGELVRHIDVLSSRDRNTSDGAGVAGSDDAYLASTGMVWESIDRLANGLSKDEKSAVVRMYKGQQGTVKDAWEEFKGIVDNQGGAEAELEGGDEDGWDELDLGGEELLDQERKRAEAAKPLLALHQILHATIPRFIDQFDHRSDGSSSAAKHTYTELIQTSTAFVDAYDEAVSSMHPGQDEEDIEETLRELESVSCRLAGMVDDKSVDKWRERLEIEKQKWEERRLDLASLGDALE
ncbi:hypothetical protein I317_03604 [Kwoniella heveanensis CBS 569]|nr:hypothetical protein I317_03604 [Kwoniella heveanensis CBS 569]